MRRAQENMPRISGQWTEKHKKSHFNKIKDICILKVIQHWNKLPGEVVESLPLETVQA